MFGFGMGELLVVLLVVFVLFGANRLPKLGQDLGAGLRSLKKALSKDDEAEAPKPPLPPADTDKQA